MREFEELCESLGVIKKTTRIMYPRQIKMSEEFLEALKAEYYRQKLEEDITGEIKNRPDKFVKALGFHVQKLEEDAEGELEAMRNLVPEESEYKPTQRDKSHGRSMPRRSKHGAGVARWVTHQEVKDKKLRGKYSKKDYPVGEASEEGNKKRSKRKEDKRREEIPQENMKTKVMEIDK